MPIMEIRGSVWPTDVKLTLPNLNFLLKTEETGIITTIACTCQESKILMKCEGEEVTGDSPNSVGFVVAQARMLFDGALSLVAVSYGRPIRFVAETIDFGAGALTINIEYPILSGLITALKPEDFVSTMVWIARDPQVLIVLHDLNAAMSDSFYQTVACGSAIDGIRHAIAGGDGDPKSKKWVEFRTALNADQQFVQMITDASIRARHGQRLQNYGHDTEEIMRRSWVLFNRFLEYRIRGNKPLTEPDFPLLVG